MCLLQCLNGHIRVIYPTSHQSVSSWPPRPPSSTLDAHWPPLEAQYLGYIRLTSTAVIYPLTCEKEGVGGCVMCSCCPLSSARPHVAAAECTAALSHAPSRRPPTPMPAAPSEDPKMPSRHRLFSPPLTPSMSYRPCPRPPPPYPPPIGG
jgi:hypothetical protein